MFRVINTMFCYFWKQMQNKWCQQPQLKFRCQHMVINYSTNKQLYYHNFMKSQEEKGYPFANVNSSLESYFNPAFRDLGQISQVENLNYYYHSLPNFSSFSPENLNQTVQFHPQMMSYCVFNNSDYYFNGINVSRPFQNPSYYFSHQNEKPVFQISTQLPEDNNQQKFTHLGQKQQELEIKKKTDFFLKQRLLKEQDEEKLQIQINDQPLKTLRQTELINQPDAQNKNKSSERQEKVKRYLIKKKNRQFTKRVTYQCRKFVADNRLRFKGRFMKRAKDEVSKAD